MLDPKLLRDDIHQVTAAVARRGDTLEIDQFQILETQRKSLQMNVEQLQNQRNQQSKIIGQAKSRGEDVSDLLAQVATLGDQLTEQKAQLTLVQQQLHEFAIRIPNLLHESVPAGNSEADNVVQRTWGEIPQFDFVPQAHDVLGEQLGLLDFPASAKISGTRFVVMRGALAQLHRALVQWMLAIHTQQHGYQEVYVPYIVNQTSLFSTGQLPKFADDQFKLEHEQELYLIPTAEVPVTNMLRDSIVNYADLPLKYVAHTPCFRKEAGAYGKDTHGMIRQHQFEKVELVWITHPEQSYAALESLTEHAQTILQQLKLPYRMVTLCSADVGFSAAKTYDLEVWLPSQQMYREISSCSNCESFQARRMQARWRNPETGKPELVHTLNGSGLAIGRTLVAILENYQDAQGNIHIPEILQPYMNGLTQITAGT
ncbi:MAG: serine--tRNA ligase [Legionellales bacterium]|nr:serine--tRNA ligase [Legionellales bacterium]